MLAREEKACRDRREPRLQLEREFLHVSVARYGKTPNPIFYGSPEEATAGQCSPLQHKLMHYVFVMLMSQYCTI